MESLWKKVIAGIAIGVGFVLPGISGGVLAVSMGLYEKMIEAIKNLLKKFKESFLYLLPIGIGGVIGVLLTSQVLKFVIAEHEAETLMLFCGFVLGSIPTLWHETKIYGRKSFRFRDALCIAAGFAFMMLIRFLDTSKAAETATLAGSSLPTGLSLAAGGVLAVGLIIPGMSSSFLLEYFGLYKSVVYAIAEINIPTLFFMGLGFLLPAALMVLLMNRVLEKYHVVSYFIIIGISVGSMTLILPDILPRATWLCIPLCLVGFALGLFVSLRQIRLKNNRAESETMVETEQIR